MQARLLRTLEEKVVVPVGAVNAIVVNVRVIAATNRDLREDVLVGRFRRDLYYRLNMIELKAIPLKARSEDIALLARHFIAAYCLENDLPETTLDAAAERILRDYDWPGNVRELKNVMERVLLANQGNVLKVLTHKSCSLLRSLLNGPSESRSAAGLMPGETSFGNGRSSRQRLAEAVSTFGKVRSDGDKNGNGEPWLQLKDLEPDSGLKRTAKSRWPGVRSRVHSPIVVDPCETGYASSETRTLLTITWASPTDCNFVATHSNFCSNRFAIATQVLMGARR